MTSIICAPDYIPEDKKQSYDRIISDAERLSRILESNAEILDCQIHDEYFIIYTKRHNLYTNYRFDLKLSYCKVESGALIIETSEKQSFFRRFRDNIDIATSSTTIGAILIIIIIAL